MKIIVNVESLTPPLTGVGQYAFQLIKEIEKNNEIESVNCFSNFRFIDTPCLIEKPSEESRPFFVKGFLPLIKRTLRRFTFVYIARQMVRNYFFQRKVKENNFEGAIYHEPNYIPKSYLGPIVINIHDLSHVRYPQFHPKERVEYLNKKLPSAVSSADHIITGSDFVRDEVIQLFGISPEKITTIPNGVGKQFKPRDKNETSDVLNAYNLKHGSYLLSVATLEPRKNIEGLIKGYLQLPRELRRQSPLVLVGSSGWNNSRLKKLIDDLESSGELRWLGYVPDAELHHIYSGAAAFAYTSFYEGFGLPLLEAMSSGVPVLTSNSSSMAEVVGDAGVLVDPDSTEEIEAGLRKLLSDRDIANEYRDAGLKRAACYSWERTAAETVQVYNMLEKKRATIS